MNRKVGHNNSSPRTRRYFRVGSGYRRSAPLFSAHAEVFPLLELVTKDDPTLLRARGGISHDRSGLRAGVFSSPRTRRYFLNRAPGSFGAHLFSAHAEVFPLQMRGKISALSLLRARGGISEFKVPLERAMNSSPRTRRYFPHPRRRSPQAGLFSAHAEVFPMMTFRLLSIVSLLRARGGISC